MRKNSYNFLRYVEQRRDQKRTYDKIHKKSPLVENANLFRDIPLPADLIAKP